MRFVFFPLTFVQISICLFGSILFIYFCGNNEHEGSKSHGLMIGLVLCIKTEKRGVVKQSPCPVPNAISEEDTCLICSMIKWVSLTH